MGSPETIRSVCRSNHEALEAIESLHCPGGFECDLTYGHGSFWRGRKAPRLKFDIDPHFPDVVKADSGNLPLEDGSLSNCVFDPPFLTYVRNGRAHKEGRVAMSSRFGGYYRYDELSKHYRETLAEARRVLKPGGVLVFKCQDIVHNHKLHPTHVNVVLWAALEQFRLLDLFVLAAKSRMPGPQRGKQRHARIFHSYFLVFEKPKSPRTPTK